MVDARFSALAAVATLIVAVAAAVAGAPVVAAVWGVLSLGFCVRAVAGFRRR
jgi:hypothetical protein